MQEDVYPASACQDLSVDIWFAGVLNNISQAIQLGTQENAQIMLSSAAVLIYT